MNVTLDELLTTGEHQSRHARRRNPLRAVTGIVAALAVPLIASGMIVIPSLVNIAIA